MGLLDGLRDSYFAWEDKYYNFLDRLDKSGIPVYAVVEPLDKIVPSFALVLLILLAIIIGLALFVVQTFLVSTVPLTVQVFDNQQSALPNVEVQARIGDRVLTKRTDVQGKTPAFDIPKGSRVVIVIDRTGFTHYESESILIDKETLHPVILQPIEIAPGPGGEGTVRRINLVNALGQPVTDTVSLSFSCLNPSVSAPQGVTVTSGSVTVTEPAGCNGLIARVTSSKYLTIDSQFIRSSPQSIFLQPIESSIGKGQLEVSVLENGTLTDNQIVVQLFDNAGTFLLLSATTADGKVLFSDLDPNTYKVKTVATTQFDSSELSNISVNALEQKSISVGLVPRELPPGFSGTIKIKVVRENTLEVIENAQVTLWLDHTEIERQTTSNDNNGFITFFVSQDESYTVIVDADDYCLETRSSIKVNPGNYVIEMEPFTASCGGTLIAQVLDQDGKAVPNASVTLANSERFFIGIKAKLSDINGVVRFEGTPAGTYTAFAGKGTISGWSDPGFFNRKKGSIDQVDLTVTMQIPNGTLRLRIVDKDGTGVPFANVFFIDTSNNQVFGGGARPADGQGVLDFETRADKKVFAIVESEGYASFVTPELMILPNVISEKTIVLRPPITKFEVELLGLYQGNLGAPPAVKESVTLSNGQEYVGRFLVKIPSENVRNDSTKKPSEIGLHVRTGDQTIMEKDLLFLKQTNAPQATVVRGTAFTGDLATDSGFITNEDAKWVNVVWNKALGSVIETNVVVKIKPSAAVGERLNLFYRAWMRVGASTTKDPIDQTGNQNELYSDAKKTEYTVGEGTACDDRFCFEASVRDPQTELTHFLENNEFFGKVKHDYTLSFSIANVSKRDVDTFANAELRVENPQENIRLKAYTIFDAAAQGSNPILGNANAFELPWLAIGDLRPQRHFSGNIAFFTEKGTSGTIVLNIVDKDRGVIVFSKEIQISVAAEKELVLMANPSQLVAGLETEVLFSVKEKQSGEPVQDATISIRDRFDTLLLSGVTNSLGNVSLKLPAQLPGDRLVAIAEKPDHNSGHAELSVSTGVAKLSPQRLGFSLNPQTKTADTKTLTIKNLAAFPLIIHRIELDGKFFGLIDQTASQNALERFKGTRIDPGEEIDIPITVQLNTTARQLTEPVDLNGTISVELANFGQVWSFPVEVGIVIGLGGEADDSKCFSVIPTEWKTNTEGKPVVLRFELQNNCSVNGQPVRLQEIEAKVVWESNPLGSFELSNAKSNSELRSGFFKTISPALAPEESQVGELRFTPSGGVNGQAKATIVFHATHPADAKPQLLETEIGVTIDIVNLLDCISISKEQLQMTANLVFAPQTTGFGQIYNKELFEGEFEDTDYSSTIFSGIGSGGFFGTSPYFNNGIYNGFNPGGFNYGFQPGFSPALGGVGFQNPGFGITTNPSTNTGSNITGRQLLGLQNPGFFPTQAQAPPQDTFTFAAKNCGGPVRIALDSELALSTRDITLQDNQTSPLIVVNGEEHYPGQYGVKISIQGAQAKTNRPVRTIPVVIHSNPQDCIQMNKFEFNIFKQSETDGIDTARVFNYCLDKPVPVLIDKHDLQDALSQGQRAATMGLAIGMLSQMMRGDTLSKIKGNESKSSETTSSTASDCGSNLGGGKCLGFQFVTLNGKLYSKPIIERKEGGFLLRQDDGTFIEVFKNDQGQYYVPVPAPASAPVAPAPAVPATTPASPTPPTTSPVSQSVSTQSSPNSSTVANKSIAVTEVVPGITGLQFFLPPPVNDQTIERTGNPRIDDQRQKDAEELSQLQILPLMFSTMGGGNDPFSMAFMMYALGTVQAYQAQEDLRILTVQKDIELGAGLAGFGFGPVFGAIGNIGLGGDRSKGISSAFGQIANQLGGLIHSQLAFNRNAFSLLRPPAITDSQRFEGVSVAEYRSPTFAPRLDNQALSTETAYIRIQNDDGITQPDRLTPLYAILNVKGIRHRYDQDQAYEKEMPTQLRELGTYPTEAKFHLQFNSFRPDQNVGEFSNELDNCSIGSLSGSTGEQAVPRVLFSWSWDAIEMNACDDDNPEYIYCDATQFSIALLKKLELLRQFTTQNAATFECPPLVSGDTAVEQTLSTTAQDVALTKLDYKKTGSDINFLATIQSNNQLQLSTTITILVQTTDEIGVPLQTVSTCTVPATVLSTTEVGCKVTGLANGAYKVTSALGAITNCPTCRNDSAVNDSISKTVLVGLDQTVVQCEPFSTLRLKQFVEATERAGKTLVYPSGLTKEQTLSLANFEAHLIKDGYSNDFRSDFDEFAKSKAFFQTPSYYSQEDGLSEFFTDPKALTFEYFGSPNNPLSQPGVYKIEIDVNFANRQFEWFKDHAPKANIRVIMEKTKDAKPASPFYNLPFDGAIGIDNGRTGYGLNYELLTPDEPVHLNRQNQGFIKLSNIVGSNPAGNLKVSRVEDFITLNNSSRGRVLSVNLQTNEIKLSPSLATPVLLKVSGTTGRDAYAFYSLEVDREPQTQVTSLTKWDGLGVTCKDFLGNDMSVYTQADDLSGKEASCAILGGNANNSFGFEWCDKTKAGNAFLETILYTPSQSPAVLRQTTAANAADFIAHSGTGNQVDLGGVPSMAFNSKTNAIATIEDVLELVRDEVVCVSGHDNSLHTEFFWNPKPVLESLQTERDNAIGQCITG